ncbi:MAG: TrmJ/YjtD family RNA methyltransferase [Pseudorhodoplanes sp.]
MPGAGTDKTKRWIEEPAPLVVLVEPQLGENIGAVARAMANFGLSRLRLVKPRVRWPSDKAQMMAAGADRVLDNAVLYDTVEQAIGDCHFVIAATARAHDQAKPVGGADEAARQALPRVAAGQTVALMFGRERNGLENDEVALADMILTLPVNPAFASLNLAQAVIIAAYEWFKLSTDNALPFMQPHKSEAAPREQLMAFFRDLEKELERVEFFRPAEKRETMTINLRNIFNRMQPTQQDIQTLHGVVSAIIQGRQGPATGGVLNSEEALRLRAVLAEHGEMPANRGPLRGLSKLLRRNPTDAERNLWSALVKDRRFAGQGFRRQVPVGPYIGDFVSFPLRTVIEIVPADETASAAAARAEKNAWLRERNYSISAVTLAEIENDVADVLDRLAAAIAQAAP